MNQVFISGFGDIGQRVAVRHLQRQDTVFALVRSQKKAAALKASGIKPVVGDLDDDTSLVDLPTTDCVVYHFAPPPASGQTDPRLANLLAAAQGQLPQKVVLISTTAVYGDCHGQWINENTPAQPQSDRGKRRLHGEQQLLAWGEQTGVPVVILRVGGIYGPHRLPVERLKQGLPILKETLSPFTNRIHEDDLAMICVAAADKAPDRAIYNVSDGKPGTMSRYFKDIAKALGLPQPREVDMEEAKRVLSAGMLSYLQESRRIDNRKLINELGVQLQYADFAMGLAACVERLKNRVAT
ncbi:SDR family oxidoreductase [Kaarinaea lacus]